MALSNPDSCVIIDGETYDLISIPSAENKLVKSARREFLEQLDLHSLADDMGKLGKFMRLAYDGVVGHTELQIKVQRVGYKITKLADKSAVTVYRFKETSQDVLEELKTTYQYLLEGLEKAAVINLSMMADKAAGMAEAAEELRSSDDVIKALEETQTAKGNQEKEKKTLEKKREEFDLKKKQAEKLEIIAREAEEKAEKLYNEAQAREEKAQGVHENAQMQVRQEMSTIRSVADSITGVLTGVTSAAALTLIFRLEKAAEKLLEIGDKADTKKLLKGQTEKK